MSWVVQLYEKNTTVFRAGFRGLHRVHVHIPSGKHKWIYYNCTMQFRKWTHLDQFFGLYSSRPITHTILKKASSRLKRWWRFPHCPWCLAQNDPYKSIDIEKHLAGAEVVLSQLNSWPTAPEANDWDCIRTTVCLSLQWKHLLWIWIISKRVNCNPPYPLGMGL